MIRKIKVSLVFVGAVLINTISFAQNDTVSMVKNKKLPFVIASEIALYGGSLLVLNDEWYKNYPRSKFHFFNDNKEWQQMDKCGHAFTSYNIGNQGIQLMKWSGVSKDESIWYGGLLGSLYLLNIEILDGLSSQWGFSIGDFTANTLGSAMLIGQELAWNEQRVVFKWSFHQSKYSKYRTEELGGNLPENMLKDYNGQTYWFSGNISSFLRKESSFPKWLNIAFGYGAEGMTGGAQNTLEVNGVTIPSFNRYRKFFISPDVDLTKIKTKSKFLRKVFFTLNFLKIPSPTLGFSKEKGLKIIPLYF